MKMQEIQDLTKGEIELHLSDEVEELYNLRFQHAMHQLDNPIRLRYVRKKIARLKTVLHEYAIGIRTQKESTKE